MKRLKACLRETTLQRCQRMSNSRSVQTMAHSSSTMRAGETSIIVSLSSMTSLMTGALSISNHNGHPNALVACQLRRLLKQISASQRTLSTCSSVKKTVSSLSRLLRMTAVRSEKDNTLSTRSRIVSFQPCFSYSSCQTH